MSLTDVDGTSVVAMDAVECLIGGRAFGCTFGTLRDALRRSADCCVDSAPQTVSRHLHSNAINRHLEHLPYCHQTKLALNQRASDDNISHQVKLSYIYLFIFIQIGII